jgi:PhnB protein
MTKPIPDGFHTITPHLTIRNCGQAIEFYQKAFGAEVVHTSPGPGGKLMHALLRIGDSHVMMADEFPEMGDTPSKSPAALGGTTFVMNIYCTDADAWYERAVKAGARSRMAPVDMFWGDRYAMVDDPHGHVWALATHKEDLTPAEMAERQAKLFGAGKPG